MIILTLFIITTEIPNFQFFLETQMFKRFQSKLSCTGCGSILHNDKTKINGYLSEMEHRIKAFHLGTSLENYKKVFLSDIPIKSISINPAKYKSSLICYRCENINRVSNNKEVPVSESFLEELAKPNLLLIMFDVLDFPYSFPHQILSLINKDQPIILIANKSDLLPDNCNVEDAIKSHFKSFNILAFHLISLKNLDKNVEKLLKDIVLVRRPKDNIIITGTTNAGKSTFWNYLIEKFEGPNIRKVTTSEIEGTTLDLIKMDIKKYKVIIYLFMLLDCLKLEI